MSKNSLKGVIILLAVTAIWGCAFVAQEEAASHLGSFTVNFLRASIAAAVLFPTALILRARQAKQSGVKEKFLSKKLIIGGILCGTALSIASNLQQIGIMFNAELAEGDSGKAGFITAMYIIFVPLFSCLFGRRLKASTVIAVIMGTVGLYFISVKDGFSVSSGDIVLLLCAVAFAVHIIMVDRFASTVDAVALSAIQFLAGAVIAGTLMLIFERDGLSLSAVGNAALPVLYCGVMSSGVAYTLQIVSQRFTEPTVASLIMSFESLFAMATACVFYRKLPTSHEVIGALFMMAAILIVETPFTDRLFAKLFGKSEAEA